MTAANDVPYTAADQCYVVLNTSGFDEGFDACRHTGNNDSILPMPKTLRQYNAMGKHLLER